MLDVQFSISPIHEIGLVNDYVFSATATKVAKRQLPLPFSWLVIQLAVRKLAVPMVRSDRSLFD